MSDDATTESIQAIINGSDVYQHLNPIETASIEARRLLYLLLADTRRSPFLYGLHHGRRADKSSKIEEQSTVYLTQLSRALHNMLSDHGHSPSMKLFLGMCLQMTPQLVPHFFRGLRLLDPKPTFRSLAALAFVEGILREAPLPLPTNSLPTNEMLAAIVPLCVTKTLLGKAVQSPSALLVSSGLKLIITILRRARDYLSYSMATAAGGGGGSGGGSAAGQTESSLRQTAMQRLPEASLLFSIPSRFDPFLKSTSSRANAVVVLQLCEAVQCYARLDPSSLANVKFDWARLVPSERIAPTQQPRQERAFGSAEPLLQHRILQTLLGVSRLPRTTFSPKMMPCVLSVASSTKIPEVYSAARELGLALVERELFSRASSNPSAEGAETTQCQRYESSLWMDGISGDVIEELVAMVEVTKWRRVQNKIAVSQAWAEAGMGYAMPRMDMSSLLSSSISRLVGAADDGAASPFSEKMTMLLVQIAAEMLVFQEDPKPLAAIIAFSVRDSTPNDKRVSGLCRVAKSILRGDPTTNALLESLSLELFLPGSRFVGVVRAANAEDAGECAPRLNVSRNGSHAALRHCLSMIKHSAGGKEELITLACKIIIRIIEVSRFFQYSSCCCPI